MKIPFSDLVCIGCVLIGTSGTTRTGSTCDTTVDANSIGDSLGDADSLCGVIDSIGVGIGLTDGFVIEVDSIVVLI